MVPAAPPLHARAAHSWALQQQLWQGLAMQLLWIGIGTLLVSLVWRRAVARFSSVGG